MGDDDIRSEAISVLDRAASMFRPGLDAHRQLSGLASRLRDPATRFEPVPGRHGIRTALLRVRAAASALADMLDGADEAVRDIVGDAGSHEASARAEAAIQSLDAVLAYDEVEAALAGSWGGDPEFVEEIHALRRRLADAGARTAAAAPAP